MFSQLLAAAFVVASFGQRVVAEPECSDTKGIHGETTASGHSLHWTKALISKRAPFWQGKAALKGEIVDIKLSDYKGKYLVMVFYPLAFTFVCPTELLAFNDRIEEFHAIGADVVAVSVDSEYACLAWQKVPKSEGGVGKLNIPLLSDLKHTISKDYGVYLEDMGHSLRGLFIVDPNGILRQITMNDLPVGRSVDETLRLVQAFKHTDNNPVVCPADWTPGKDTIVPDPEKKLEYFKNTNKEL